MIVPIKINKSRFFNVRKVRYSRCFPPSLTLGHLCLLPSPSSPPSIYGLVNSSTICSHLPTSKLTKAKRKLIEIKHGMLRFRFWKSSSRAFRRFLWRWCIRDVATIVFESVFRYISHRTLRGARQDGGLVVDMAALPSSYVTMLRSANPVMLYHVKHSSPFQITHFE